jgi:hypothetical protein
MLIYENRVTASPAERSKAGGSSQARARRRTPRRVGKIPIE